MRSKMQEKRKANADGAPDESELFSHMYSYNT